MRKSRTTMRGEKRRIRPFLRICVTAAVCAVALTIAVMSAEKTSAEPVKTPEPAHTQEPEQTAVFDVELVKLKEPEKLTLTGGAPTVLIYHTHATEAYRQTEDSQYEESGSFRTLDEEKNVVAVGEVLKDTLYEEYGIVAMHDTTNHEPPKLATAYSRSVKTMEKYRAEYPTIELYIDLHRDAYGKSESGAEDYVTVDGVETARLMFVVGTGEGATGTGFDEMPDFEGNYALAEELTRRLNEIAPGITRSIRVKTGRYNQHIGRCILAEIGHNANTLEQAKNAARLLARVIAEAAGAANADDTMLPLAP